VRLLQSGFWFYVCGVVLAEKDPKAIDAKLLKKYGIEISKWARARRKKQGLANVHYLRRGRFWILMATHGKHDFFEQERANIRDARRVPLRFEGYAVSYRCGADGKHHPHVRIGEKEYKALKAFMESLAVHRSPEKLVNEFWSVPFEPYAPVRRQLFNVLRSVNRARQAAGYKKLPYQSIPFKRKIVKPFAKV
jgi:hypothetical protein